MNTFHRIESLLEAGPMFSKDIAACLGLSPRQVSGSLIIMEKRGDAVPVPVERGRRARMWTLKGRSAVQAYLVEQHQTAIGRYLTGAPL